MDARVNFAYGTVTAAPSPDPETDTEMDVSGSWPDPPFNAVVHAAGATEEEIASGAEIVRVTDNTAGTWTIERASEGPNAARAIQDGDIVKAGVTARTIDDMVALFTRGTYVGDIAGYDVTPTFTEFQGILGTAGSPFSGDEAVAIFQKVTDSDSTGSQVNATLAATISKQSAGDSTRATAVFGGADDMIGDPDSFVEGGRFHGFLRSDAGGGGAGYGVLGVAGGSANVDYQFMVGMEGQLYQNSGADAPAWESFTKDRFSASFLASNSGSYKSDVGFMTNPFNTHEMQAGFVVGEGSVTGAAFASRDATVYGLDLWVGAGLGSQSSGAIRIPNNTSLKARNNAGSSSLNFAYVDTTDRLVLGTDCSATRIVTSGHAMTVPSSSSDDVLAALDLAQTMTNKRITKRIGTTASSSTPTPDADAHDVYTVTALAAGATFGAPTGTPTNGQGLIIRIKDNGTARSLAWNGAYRASTDLALPSTTVISKTLYLGFIYNSADSKWDLLAKLDNF